MLIYISMQFSEMHGAGYVNVNMVITKSFLIFKEIQGCFFHHVQDFQRVTQKVKGIKTEAALQSICFLSLSINENIPLKKSS